MARRVFYQEEIPEELSINDRFAELSGRDRYFLPTRPVELSPREGWISEIGIYFRELSTSELEILTGRDTIRMHPSQIKSTYRVALISEAKAGLNRMDDDHLQRIHSRIPFSVVFVPAETSRPQERRATGRDLSDRGIFHPTRPASRERVTRERLDRELDEYFMQDPVRFKAILDRELDEYMSGRAAAAFGAHDTEDED